MSVRETDVKKITRLDGLDAFRAQLEETGATKLSGELPPDAGSATIRGSARAPLRGAAPAAAPGAAADRQLGPAGAARGVGRLRAAERGPVTPGRRAEGRADPASEVSCRPSRLAAFDPTTIG